MDALSFFLSNKKKFDLILIKQTIHLLKISDIRKLISNCKKSLNPEGIILIFTLDPRKNELPSFKMMEKKLNKSFKRDFKISNLLLKLSTSRILKRFVFRVKITKKQYLKMLQMRFISTLLSMSKKDLLDGVEEINLRYKHILNFNDNLICIRLNNN